MNQRQGEDAGDRDGRGDRGDRGGRGAAGETGVAGVAGAVGTVGTADGTDGTAVEQVGTIGRKAGRGLRWSLLGNLGTKATTFVMGLVLARLLVPEDFGLYAIALAATTFVMHVNDVGIIAATVQWRGRVEDMAPTATVMALAFSTGIYGIFWVVAPYFAELAGSAEATPVVRLLTAIILIDGVTAVRAGTLMRGFGHDRLIKANIAGSLVNAAVAVTLAANGAGAYSFACGQVTANAVTGALVLAWAGLPFRLGFDREVAARLLRFGAPLALGLGIEAVLMNADYVIVGAVLGPAALGFYLLAFNVSSWVPSVIGTALRYVTVPSFSRLAEQRPESLSLGVQRSVPLLVAFVLPVAVVTATLAPEIVAFLYGEKWAPAAGVLALLAVLLVVRMLTSLAFDVLTSAGATRATVWMNLGWAVALVPALWAGTHWYGIRGAAIGHALAGLLVALPLAALMLSRAGVRLAPVLPALVRPLLGAAGAAAVIVALAGVMDGSPFVRLCVAGGGGLLAYVLLAVPAARLRQLGARAVPAR
ncbi:oligosaccharide flippase family protein [Streptosporangium sp. NBC_01755]|uniref:oligosaccharide flippase family protein n=1 Tax=unclassified Streptosporangium TaxID=2632669 RepID=UPI002DDACBDC|nr:MULTISPECIES: oligosaccharide flippase family protein [unclassified Streptosporangium]WSA24781.1 oligosaccharide flippase family protein [Streptosporangium sp. NBC_01810]WSC97140.1 oligosaccharide flippase family protein [Streptosporangium sp. NBC_01755]